MGDATGEIEKAHRAVSLLLQAARIDPVLVEAARTVDCYLHDVEAETDRLRGALRIAHMHALQGGYGGREDSGDRYLVRTALGADAMEGDHA